jgi:hypothetical protein
MTLHVTAVVLGSLLLAYHQITTWGPLYPWNDVEKYSRNELLVEAGVNGVTRATGLVCLIAGNAGFAHWYPLIYYPGLFVGECVDWWIPYLSPRFAKARKAWDYDRHFARTVKLIPHQPGKRTPDANHIVLHAMTVAAIIVVYLDRLG